MANGKLAFRAIPLFKRATAAQWTSGNDVLLRGELAIETDTNKIKVGDGTTAWGSLPYINSTGGGASAPTTVTVTPFTASHTMVTGNVGNVMMTFDSASPVVLTIPADATLDVPVGSVSSALQLGDGQLSVTAGPGATVLTSTTNLVRAKNGSVGLIKVAANTWLVSGDLEN